MSKSLNMNIVINRGRVELRNANREVHHLSEQDTAISCGVKQLYGISNFAIALKNARNRVRTEAGKLEFDARIESELITALKAKKRARCAFLLISNTVTGVADTWFGSILDKICVSTNAKTNPNSGNKIKVWVF
jgi:hypothetical protein